MGTFEMEQTKTQTDVVGTSRIIKDECVISLKVYDMCRQQDCLTPQVLGPARAAECTVLGDRKINEGEVIVPPEEAGGIKTQPANKKKDISDTKN